MRYGSARPQCGEWKTRGVTEPQASETLVVKFPNFLSYKKNRSNESQKKVPFKNTFFHLHKTTVKKVFQAEKVGINLLLPANIPFIPEDRKLTYGIVIFYTTERDDTQ